MNKERSVHTQARRAYKILVKNCVRRRYFGDPKIGWTVLKMDPRAVDCRVVKCIELVHCSIHCRTVAGALTKF